MGTVFCVVSLLVVVFLAMFIGVRKYYYEKSYVGTRNGIDEELYVELNGQEQYLLIKGRDINNPVMVYLHGGPGGPDSMIFYEWAPYLADDYTMVAWDQRGCGNTYYRNKAKDPENKTATFTQELDDLDMLVEYLCRRFNQEKVIILGHSYGTLLGSRYVQKHPEKVSYYVGISQLVSILAGETAIYKRVEKIAQSQGKDIAKLKAVYEEYMQNICPENQRKFRMLVIPFLSLPKMRNVMGIGLRSPYLSLNGARWQLKCMFQIKELMRLTQPLMAYMFQADLFEESLEYRVPVAFIQGSCDPATPSECSREYLEKIEAPKKEMVLLEGQVHCPHFDKPKEFAEVLKKLIFRLGKMES